WQGEYDLVRRLSDEALHAFEEIGDDRGMYQALFCSARVAWFTGDLERAADLFERSAAMQRVAGDWFGVAGAIGNLGGIARQQGDLQRATRLIDEALSLTRAQDFVSQSAIWLGNLGKVMLHRGELEGARSLFTECLVLQRMLRGRRTAVDCLDGLALLTSREGQPELATTMYGAVTALREEFGIPRLEADRLTMEPVLTALAAALGAERYAEAWAAGGSMSLDETISRAIQSPPLAGNETAIESPARDLSRRELDVLRLLTHGKTDREIGAELFISHHTVANHVANILGKLDVESRTAAAIWAVRNSVA
ncbi:MAG TPA: tetratricopeptide repeat protein, partial [Thermomicrobiales bacterium]|nr:tetratricopeptide repeat protein [Thermomicrobiales bacterium]